MRPSRPAWLASTCAIDTMCCLGISRKCTGAQGWMSWKAKISSSSYTFFEGILPSAILQKMQLGSCWLMGSERRLAVVEADPAADATVQVPEGHDRPGDRAGKHEQHPQR